MQLLNLVVRKERPDLADLGEQLVEQQNGFKIKMKELEDNILYKLATAEGARTIHFEFCCPQYAPPRNYCALISKDCKNPPFPLVTGQRQLAGGIYGICLPARDKYFGWKTLEHKRTKSDNIRRNWRAQKVMKPMHGKI